MLRLVAAAPAPSETRRETIAGVEYLVVPTVAMVEGVRQPLGSTGPEFISAEELGRALGGWNGRPVVFHEHPTVNGQPVSTATPERWENVVGQTFNAAMDGPRLLLEAWIDAALKFLKPRGRLAVVHRADRLDDLLAALDKRCGEATLIPLWPRAGEPARRVIVRARKAVRSPSQLLPGLVLHGDDGKFTPEAEAVLRGGAGLD